MNIQKLTSTALVAALIVIMVSMMVLIVAAAPMPASAASGEAPQVIVTPVSVPADRAARAKYPITFVAPGNKTTDGRSIMQLPDYNVLDLQWVVDVGTVNTTTLKLQFSNDGNNWVDGPTIQSAIVADANNIAQYAIYGRYVAVYWDVTNTNPISMTLIGVAK